MVDDDWAHLQQLMAEETEQESRWLSEGGSHLCDICDRRKCIDHKPSNHQEEKNGN